jgi:hypothetical protein
MPFVLPQKVDRTPFGFTMTFLKANAADQLVSVGDIEAQVESIAGADAPLPLVSRAPRSDSALQAERLGAEFVIGGGTWGG